MRTTFTIRTYKEITHVPEAPNIVVEVDAQHGITLIRRPELKSCSKTPKPSKPYKKKRFQNKKELELVQGVSRKKTARLKVKKKMKRSHTISIVYMKT